MLTKRLVRNLVIATALLLLANVFVRPDGPDLRTDAGRRELVARGDELRAALERYHARTGQYPKSLRQLDVSFRWKDRAFGGWDYGREADGKEYYLRVGGYVRYGFVLYCSSTSKEWSWDT